MKRANTRAKVICLAVTAMPSLGMAQLLSDGVLDTQPLPAPLEKVVRPVQEQLEQAVERSAEQGASLDSTINQVSEAVDSLGTLPDRLPISDLNGALAFTDVRVENGFRAVERQWLVIAQPGEIALLEQIGAEILEQSPFPSLDMTLLRFRVSDDLDSLDALRQLLPPDLVDRLDRNHIYNPQSQSADTEPGIQPLKINQCLSPVKIGMVDTAIQRDHPAFINAKKAKIIEQSFLGDALEQPDAHGTAVAGLLIGTDGKLSPRLSEASLYNASVFYARSQYAQGATMMHLLKGLDWLVQNDVSVINMSLTGPDNKILATVINQTIKKGKVIVAAAGNEGPASPPLYPAAYPAVISVTAVDAEQHIYRWANHGDYVDFAAEGVSVLTARSGGVFGRESGTSMAAPIVTALVACELANNGGKRTAAIDALINQALDLGAAGRDPVFGYGLLR